MRIILNIVVSFIYAAIIAGISSVKANGFDMDVLRYALYDFLIVQIFLMLLEMYLDHMSQEMKLLKKQKYHKYINGLIDFDSENDVDPVKEKLVILCLEKCLEYCQLKRNQNVWISVPVMKQIIDMLSRSSNSRNYFCRIGQFQISDLDNFDKIIIFYNAYLELYRFEQSFKKATTSDKVSFYRGHEETEFKSYYIFDEQYAVVEDQGGNYVLYSNHDIIQGYLRDFRANGMKAVPFGKTQSQDSLFQNQAIKEFYGDGNIPDIHLDKIPDGTMRKILDLGTGAGRLLNYFTDASKYEIIALDKDKTALEQCRHNFNVYSHIEFRWEEFNEESFSPEQFDAVIAFNSLYHTDRANMSKVISRVKQILKPGGYFFLTLKTLEGNEKVYRHAGELFPEKPENTFVNTDFPDYYLPHHFCDDEEIRIYLNKFSRVIFREEIPYKEHNGVIVQGRGFFYILQK